MERKKAIDHSGTQTPRAQVSSSEVGSDTELERKKREKAKRDSLLTTFGAQLESAREARLGRDGKKLTQRELGEQIGFEPKSSIISYYESGDKSPDWPTVVALANVLKVDVSYFLGEEGPTWHVINNNNPDIYIESRNLATQQILQNEANEQGEVRQYGVRLPMRIMSKAHIEAHLIEIPDDKAQTSMREVWQRHRTAIEEARTADDGSVTPLFGYIHGIMKVGEFRKLLYLDPPYDSLACVPEEAKGYLAEELKQVIAEGYQFRLVPDQTVDKILRNKQIYSYKTVATIGDKLAIRQDSDFEIAWSFDRKVIAKFSDALGELVVHSTLIGAKEVEQCIMLINATLDQIRSNGRKDWRWSDPKLRKEWRATIQRMLKLNGPEWLREGTAKH